MYPKTQYLKKCIEVFKGESQMDIFNVDYTCGRESFIPNLISSNLIFCDNVILWSIGTNHRVYIQKVCKKLFSNSF